MLGLEGEIENSNNQRLPIFYLGTVFISMAAQCLILTQDLLVLKGLLKTLIFHLVLLQSLGIGVYHGH